MGLEVDPGLADAESVFLPLQNAELVFDTIRTVEVFRGKKWHFLKEI